jgi:hypothetical protein
MAPIKSSLHKNYAIDLSKEESGVWQDFEGGISLCIRRLNSEASLKAREEAEKPHKLKARNGSLSDDVVEDIATRQLAFGVISDWKGITDENGDEIPYSGQTAYEFLSDPELKDFRIFVFQYATDRASYKKDLDEDSVKN